MSTEFSVIKNTGRDDVDLNLTNFAGPVGKGQMLQLTQGYGKLIQLTIHDACRMVRELNNWLEEKENDCILRGEESND